MPLPNPSMSFSPFAILTAEEMNNLVENIESLASGSGIGNGAISQNNMNGASFYNDSYSATSLPAPGEFADTTRTTFDITNIPVGSLLIVSAVCSHADATYGNARIKVLYSSYVWMAQNYGQYGVSGSVSPSFRKQSGQNTVTIQSGGSRVQNVSVTISQIV